MRELMRSKNRYRDAQQARDDLVGLAGAGFGLFTPKDAGGAD